MARNKTVLFVLNAFILCREHVFNFRLSERFLLLVSFWLFGVTVNLLLSTTIHAVDIMSLRNCLSGKRNALRVCRALGFGAHDDPTFKSSQCDTNSLRLCAGSNQNSSA